MFSLLENRTSLFKADLLEKMKSLKNSVKNIQVEMERTNTILYALASKTGLSEVEEEVVQ